MTDFIRIHTTLRLGALASALALAPALVAQATPKSTAPRDSGRVRLDTAEILASARPEIEAANAAWLPGLRQHDAKSIAAPYADSGLFIAGDGTVTYNFDRVDAIYDQLLDIGIRPVVELSFMPAALRPEPRANCHRCA